MRKLVSQRTLQQVSLQLEYPVYFTEGIFDPGNADLVDALCFREPQRQHRLLVVLDSGVAEAFPRLTLDIQAYASRFSERMRLVDVPFTVPGGEGVKNDSKMFEALLERMNQHGIDRHAFILAIGGGAVLDMAGYAAAVAHRGVRMVRVPTTVLAQADSGVGVKSAINAFGKKNFLGSFAAPFAVLNDARFLSTLSPRDLRAGMAEAVKVGLVRDGAFFEWISEHARALASGELSPLQRLIERSANLHLRHIATGGDPFELGSARPLDFGHWVAHKLESLSGHALRHGEAVAIGMAVDSLYSAKSGLCAAGVADAVLTTLDRLGFALWDKALTLEGPQGRRLVLDGLSEFREHLGGELTVTLLEGIGRGVEVHEMKEGLVLEVLEALELREATRR